MGHRTDADPSEDNGWAGEVWGWRHLASAMAR